MKRRKVLICDDEMIMRKGLKVFIDWSQYGIDSILTAADGTKAIEIFHEEKPDIVVTDIRMPGMNGIQLIEALHSISPDTVFIIISGYDDFEIARQGFSVGAFDYLLKPIQADQLSSVVKRGIALLEEKERKIEELDDAKNLLIKTRPVLIQNLVQKILRGNFASKNEKLNEEFSKLGISFNFEYYRSIVGSMILPLRANVEKESLFEIIRQTIREIFPIRNEMIEANSLTVYDNNSFNMLIGFSSSDYWSILENKITDAFSAMEKSFKMSYTLIFGQITKSLNDINYSFTQTKKLCDFLQFTKQFGTFNLEDIRISMNQTFLIPLEKKKMFLKCIEKNEMIQEQLLQIKQYILQLPVKDKDFLFSDLIDIMMSGAKLLTEHGKNIQNIYTFEVFSNDFLNSFENIDYLFDWLKQYFNVLTDLLHNMNVLRTDDTAVETVKKYIRNNYSLPLTLKAVAEMNYYNPNYFGRLFYKHEKQKFSDYLHHVRIAKAQELLQDPQYSYQEISEMVGYNDVSYFFKVFKKIAGSTPGSCKKVSRGKDND